LVFPISIFINSRFSAASRSVKLINGAKANNVYWYVGSAVINYAGGGVMVGNVIANNGVTLSAQ
jgi:hypothetical protein